MTTWKSTFRLNHLWQDYHNSKISLQEFAKSIAREISTQFEGLIEVDLILTEIWGNLSNFPENGSPDDFDKIWGVFYEWADDNSVWVDIAL